MKLIDSKRPIVGLVAGLHAPSGVVMGHSGAIETAHSTAALRKRDLFREAGVLTVNHPSKFGAAMARLLQTSKIGPKNYVIPPATSPEQVPLGKPDRKDVDLTHGLRSDEHKSSACKVEQDGIVYVRLDGKGLIGTLGEHRRCFGFCD